MTALTVHTCCQYLTAGGNWRDVDHNARVIVKIAKGKPFNGYFDTHLDGKPVRLNENNLDVGLDKIARVLSAKLRELTNRPVILVPVPNSGACINTTPQFRTLLLAEAVAKYSQGLATASPAILWKTSRTAQHQSSGYRQASQFIPNLSVPRRTPSPVVLIDDVITSGSQMLACTYLLRRNGIEVPFGMAVGRTTQVQTPQALEWVSEEITQLII